MIGIGMPSSQRRIGIFRFLRMVVRTRQMGPVALRSTGGTPIKSGTASNDSVLYRRNTVTPLQRIGI